MRKRQYTVGGSHNAAEKYQPGFPMNLLANAKIFYIAGAAIMIGSVVVAAVLAGTGNNSSASADLPTPTVTPTVDPNATPTATPTPNPRQFSAAEQVIDAQNKDYRAVIKTSKGDFTINLFADKAPNTVNSFVFLAQKDYFDGLTFHRIRDGFVIQGGDPKGNGTGGPGYVTKEEPNEIRNTRGTLSMAKSSGSDQFGSQFFINLKDNTSLDFDNPSQNRFYPFAEVVEGMDVVDAIAKVPVEPNEQGEPSKPVEPVTINDVVIEESNK